MIGEVVARALTPGAAAGPILLLEDPLSLWGGLDPATGAIIDRRHPQCGAEVTGRILALPHGRGSSSSSSILAEAVRRGTAPAAILLGAPDHIIGLGAVVARELYGSELGVVVLDARAYAQLVTGLWAEVDRDGRVFLGPPRDRGA